MFKKSISKISNYLNDKIISPSLNTAKNVTNIIKSNKNKVAKILLASTIGFAAPVMAKDNVVELNNHDISNTSLNKASINTLRFGSQEIDSSVIKIKSLNKVSIVDLFKDLGITSSYKNRKIVFNHFFSGENYRGTYKQNVKFINKTKEYIINGNTGVELKEELIKNNTPIIEGDNTITKNDKLNEEKIVSGDNSANLNTKKVISKVDNNSSEVVDNKVITILDRFRKSIGFKRYNKLRKTNPENAERFKKDIIKGLEAKWGKDKTADDYLNENNGLISIVNIKREYKNNNSTLDYKPAPVLEKENTGDFNINGSESQVSTTTKFEDKGNYRLELGLIAETSNTQNNDVLAEASFSALYSGAKLGTYIGIKKGTNLEKFILSQGSKFNGNKIKLSVGLLKKVMNFDFNKYGKKDIELTQKTFGLEHTYYANNNDFIHEFISSVIYYDTDGKKLGVIGNLITDTSVEYDWSEVNGGVRGGNKFLAEFKGVFKINEKTKFGLTGGYEETKFNAFYDKIAKKEVGYRYGTDLTYRFNDNHEIYGMYSGSSTGLSETTVKYEYNHGNGLSAFIEGKHLEYNGNTDNDNKILVGLRYVWGGVSNTKSRIQKLFTSKGTGNLVLDDLKPSNNINTDEIQVFEKIIWNNHIVYVDKSTLGTTGFIEKNSDNTLKYVNLDTGVTNLVSIDNVDDIKYLPYLTIYSNQYVRVSNFKSLNNLMGTEGLVKGDIKILRIKIKDSVGTYSAYELKLTKGSVEFKIIPISKNGLIESEIDSYINGIKTINELDRLPVIGGTPNITINEGSSYSFTPTFSDPDGDIPLFSIIGKPSWATFNTSTGELSGTPDYNSSGTYSNIIISATANSKVTTLNSFNITVNNVDLPEITSITFSGITPDTKNTSYIGLLLVTNTDIKSIEGLTSSAGGFISNVQIVNSTTIRFDWAGINANSTFFNLTATANDNDQTTTSLRQLLPN